MTYGPSGLAQGKIALHPLLEESIAIGLWDRAVLGLTEFATARDADTAYEEAKDKFEYMQKRYQALKARMRAARHDSAA
jgi:hypothetical protein